MDAAKFPALHASAIVVDSAVLEFLSQTQDCTFVSAAPHAKSHYAIPTKILMRSNSDGAEKTYFAKYVPEPDAEAKVHAEYAIMCEHHRTSPSLVPRPHGWGRCADSPDLWFVVLDFLDLVPGAMPDPVKLAAALGGHHMRSRSPNGKFGFSVPTFDGTLALNNKWADGWPTFFAQVLQTVRGHHATARGPDLRLDAMMDVIVKTVIPRLLGALGPHVKPCLIHGDLWESNIGTDAETGDVRIYDSCGYYAHREMDLGIWRPPRNLGGDQYRGEYFRHFPPDEPAEEYDDRNRLYSLYSGLCHSYHFRGSRFLPSLYENVEYLVLKYGEDQREADDGKGSVNTAR